jgi:excisionase family DNA binding protein
MPPAERWFTIKEVAALLGVSDSAVRHWIYKRYLPAVSLGTGLRPRVRIRERDLNALLERPSWAAKDEP